MLMLFRWGFQQSIERGQLSSRTICLSASYNILIQGYHSPKAPCFCFFFNNHIFPHLLSSSMSVGWSCSKRLTWSLLLRLTVMACCSAQGMQMACCCFWRFTICLWTCLAQRWVLCFLTFIFLGCWVVCPCKIFWCFFMQTIMDYWFGCVERK